MKKSNSIEKEPRDGSNWLADVRNSLYTVAAVVIFAAADNSDYDENWMFEIATDFVDIDVVVAVDDETVDGTVDKTDLDAAADVVVDDTSFDNIDLNDSMMMIVAVVDYIG